METGSALLRLLADRVASLAALKDDECQRDYGLGLAASLRSLVEAGVYALGVGGWRIASLAALDDDLA